MTKVTVETDSSTVVYTYEELGHMDEMVFLFNSILQYLGFWNNVVVEE